MCDFWLNGAVVERVDSYKFLGFLSHATKDQHFGTEALKLPILSYGCEVWGVNAKCGDAAEALHNGILKALLSVRKSTATHTVLAELSTTNSLLAASLALLLVSS